MIRKIIITSIILVFYQHSFAQNDADISNNFIWNIGIQAGIKNSTEQEFTELEIKNFNGIAQFSSTTVTIKNRKAYKTFSFSGILSGRYKLWNISQEKVLSISAGLGLNINPGYAEYSYTENEGTPNELFSIYDGVHTGLGIQIPIYFAYNYGNGSTIKSEKEKGFSAGLGVEISNDYYYSHEQQFLSESKTFVTPAMYVSYLFWHKSQDLFKLRELFLKVGSAGLHKNIIQDNVSSQGVNNGRMPFESSIILSIGLNFYPNY